MGSLYFASFHHMMLLSWWNASSRRLHVIVLDLRLLLTLSTKSSSTLYRVYYTCPPSMTYVVACDAFANEVSLTRYGSIKHRSHVVHVLARHKVGIQWNLEIYIQYCEPYLLSVCFHTTHDPVHMLQSCTFIWNSGMSCSLRMEKLLWKPTHSRVAYMMLEQKCQMWKKT